jgi:hypothetical protein
MRLFVLVAVIQPAAERPGGSANRSTVQGLAGSQFTDQGATGRANAGTSHGPLFGCAQARTCPEYKCDEYCQ